MTIRPAVCSECRVVLTASGQRGSSWRLDASSPQKQVADAGNVVVG
jgi:hypothetical protein